MLRFDDACAPIEAALRGTFRREVVAAAASTKDLRASLQRIRDAMRTHVWKAGAATVALDAVVRDYDAATRATGFHAIHDWDGKADRSNDDLIAIDVLNLLIDKRGGEAPDTTAIAILIDYYFLYLLGLASLRIWDDGDADENLGRLGRLLEELQGGGGSGHQFAADAETLMLIATSHFELRDRAYDALLERVRRLNGAHQTRIALGHAAAMGGHLRFGFEVTYVRNWTLMRDDNGVDYRWLLFALAALMREYARIGADGASRGEAATIAEAIVNGLTADPAAMLTDAHASLGLDERELEEFRALFQAHKADLVERAQPFRPLDSAYSPMSLFFNFSSNVLKGTVIDALMWGEAWTVSLSDMFTSLPSGEGRGAAKEKLAQTLMGYARANPDTIGGRLKPVIVYDPPTGRRSFAHAMGVMRNA